MVTSFSVLLPSFLAWESSDQILQRQRICRWELMEGSGGGFLFGPTWLQGSANNFVCRGHCRWDPANVESEEASLNSSKGLGSIAVSLSAESLSYHLSDDSFCGPLAAGRDAK